MIHIVTVHWQTDRWISVQRAYLDRHLQNPYRLYAWLNDVPNAQPESFYYSCSEPLNSHAVKLNLLAEIVSLSSHRDDDLLIFLDGDAFPIRNLDPLLREKLSAHKLIAVQRLENNGDAQPHPCFCVTTVGFWRTIKGDWKAGHDWRNKDGKSVTDVGGNLLKQLTDRQVPWYPLLRSNKRNLHPVLFGVYDDIVYHHGAGFRTPTTRADGQSLGMRLLSKVAATAPRRYREALRQKFFGRLRERNNLMSERVFNKIKADPLFFNEFI